MTIFFRVGCMIAATILLRRRDSFSPCRVLPFVVRSAVEATNRLPQVTLSTHATADQVYGIVELARRWDGPLSLAVFAPGLDAGLAVAQLDRACRCEPAMYKVSSISSARPRISRRTRNVLRSCDFVFSLIFAERESDLNVETCTFRTFYMKN